MVRYDLALAALLGCTLGVCVGRLMWAEPPNITVAETAKSAIAHDDGTVTAPVVVAEQPKLPGPTKPSGGETIRVIEVTVEPPQRDDAPDRAILQDCPSTKLRIDLDRYDTGIRASIWANGRIVETADYALASLVERQPTSSIGVAAFTDGTKQVQYTRFFKRLSVSGYLAHEGGSGVEAGIGANFLLR